MAKNLLFSFSQCLRHAFFCGAGYGDLEKISEEDQQRWTMYDPPEVGSFKRIKEALGIPSPQTNARVWTQADAERENSAFARWFKERGYPDYPDLYPPTTENAMHAAWQEAAKRTVLAATATEGSADA